MASSFHYGINKNPNTEIQMKRIFFICTMMLVCISGFSQKFTATDNLVFEEISETEFRRAYQTKNKNVFRWKKKGRQYKRTVTTFLDTDIAKRNVSLSESIDKLAWTMPSERNEGSNTNVLIKPKDQREPARFGLARKRRMKSNLVSDETCIRCLKLKSGNPDNAYILQEIAPVCSNAYYIKGETPDSTAMFGIGDVDNMQIYYACPDFDCDQHVWCRWYSFANGKVRILAELEETSFEYDFADYDLPSFFADNKGLYYIAINKNPNIFNDVSQKVFYSVRLED